MQNTELKAADMDDVKRRIDLTCDKCGNKVCYYEPLEAPKLVNGFNPEEARQIMREQEDRLIREMMNEKEERIGKSS